MGVNDVRLTCESVECVSVGVKDVRLTCESVECVSVGVKDVRLALREVRPSAMREVVLEVPKVHWSDIGGQERVKQRMREAVEWPLTHPEVQYH